MLRRLKNQFKEPIYKDDLKYVIINGLISMLLFGLICGFIDVTMSIIFNVNGNSITFAIFLLPYLIGRKIRKSLYNYHILYSILTFVFILISVYFYQLCYTQVTLYHYLNMTSLGSFKMYTTLFKQTYFPSKILSFLRVKDFSIVFWSIIEIILFNVSLYQALKIVKRGY